MLICNKCKAPVKNGRCILCDSKRNIKEACNDDMIYVTSSEPIFSQIIEDCLNDNKIPFIRKSLQGSAVTVILGNTNESYRYYVMLEKYDDACGHLEGLPMPMTEEELEQIALLSEDEDQ